MTSGGPPYPFGQGPGGYGPPPPRRPGKLIGLGVALAVLLSAAALIVGVIALVRQPDTAVTATPSSLPTTPGGDTSAADEALCKEVGPLLREVVDEGKRFVALGRSGTQARDDGITSFRVHVAEWATRIESIVDENSNASRYLSRTLHGFVDLNRLYAANIRPGPATALDTQTWDLGTIAYGGPWEVCHALGVTW